MKKYGRTDANQQEIVEALRKAQKRFHDLLPGSIHIVESVPDALRMVGLRPPRG